MAHEGVTWSTAAQKDLRAILKYWKGRNKSDVYNERLLSLLKKAIDLIEKHPEMGAISSKRGCRQKPVENFTIVYKILPTQITIVRIWSPSRNPDKLFGH